MNDTLFVFSFYFIAFAFAFSFSFFAVQSVFFFPSLEQSDGEWNEKKKKQKGTTQRI